MVSLGMKRSSKESQTRLFATVEIQGGFFTAKQAKETGFDRTHHAYHIMCRWGIGSVSTGVFTV